MYVVGVIFGILAIKRFNTVALIVGTWDRLRFCFAFMAFGLLGG